ncbi:hypothetical protein CLPU_4c02570 [Gottschalkia purinilytica]|uniref:Uncharacterized protein n=1 Tax=Gottschalkia purinilytica TaxID=1503 RepID=A0A0L0WCM5_GOTPU|nr:hypothetical protein [Gottschalkia purinilytica]KNF09211.1 hypothetical protein CLPU_4c02570 [Gottschalkia purinilytica]
MFRYSKYIVSTIIIIPLLVIGFGGFIDIEDSVSVMNITNKKFKVNEIFRDENIKLKEEKYILDIKRGDVTGDNKEDTIFLLGKKKSKNSLYAENLSIVVKNETSKKYILMEIPNSSGEKNILFLGDFNGDKIKDVLVESSLKENSQNKVQGIYTFIDNNIVTLVSNEELNRNINFELEFKDDYIASINNKETRSATMIDISSKKEIYIGTIYNEDGKVINNKKLNISGYEYIRPVDNNLDGVYELEGHTKIIGEFDTDIISTMISLIEYKDKKFKIKSIENRNYMYMEYE